jgi:transcriptional regulator with XRE-family HTH domain
MLRSSISENWPYTVPALKQQRRPELKMNKSSIGKKLRQIRRERDITQTVLAKKLGVTAGFVSQYECGDSFPSIQVLIGLSKALKVSLDELLLDKAALNGTIKDPEIYTRFQAIQNLPEEQKTLIKTYLDGFLARKSA